MGLFAFYIFFDLFTCFESEKSIGLEGLAVSVFGILGVYWGIFTSFRAEFADKYKRLAALIDNAPCSECKNLREKYFDVFYLNFAEDCLHYHMEKEDAFKYIFDNTVAVLLEIKGQSNENFKKAMIPWELLPQHIGKISKDSKKVQSYANHLKKSLDCKITRASILKDFGNESPKVESQPPCKN